MKQIASSCIALFFGLLFSVTASAAQVVVQDTQTDKGIPGNFGCAATSDLVYALSQQAMVSIVSHYDALALLERDAIVFPGPCNDEKCLIELAESIGSEFFLSSTLTKEKKRWVMMLKLVDLDDGRVYRRSTGKSATEGLDGVSEAVNKAVGALFKKNIPRSRLGPQSLSKLGFKAAALGLVDQIRTKDWDPLLQRQRVVRDLIHTELDYDAAPKFDYIYSTISQEKSALRRESLMAADRSEAERFVWAGEYWNSVYQDLERVQELRKRARERGETPVGYALRYEEPGLVKWPEPQASTDYKETCPCPLIAAKEFLEAFEERDTKTMKLYMTDEYIKRAESAGYFAEEFKPGEMKHTIPDPDSLTPDRLENVVSEQKGGRILIYSARVKDDKLNAEVSMIWVEKDPGVWWINSYVAKY